MRYHLKSQPFSFIILQLSAARSNAFGCENLPTERTDFFVVSKSSGFSFFDWDFINSAEYIEQQARKELRMIKENELLFIVEDKEDK